MSRNIFPVDDPDVTIIYGDDHALGGFFQITHNKFIDHPQDESGEGYIIDWDLLFGFGINLINATVDDFKDAETMWSKIKPKVDEFIKSLNL